MALGYVGFADFNPNVSCDGHNHYAGLYLPIFMYNRLGHA